MFVPNAAFARSLVLLLVAVLTVTARPSLAQQGTTGTVRIQQFKTNNFRIRTDLSEEEAKELLVRLETMLRLVSGYFGKRTPRPIDMYVAKEIDRWPDDVLSEMDPYGVAQIRAKAGVTISQSVSQRGRIVDAKSVVYAVADRGTPQHEAVHAYCAQAFGRTGPVWYSEGMAEVGNYWKEGDPGVTAPTFITDYLRQAERKPLDQIVNSPLETTGDSWQNYAWRWALCHLLGHNENYSKRFKPLGMALLGGKDMDFWTVYGSQAAEIEFEYNFFLDHLEPGYRVDLCSWDWSAKFIPPRRSGTISKIKADRGWQSSKVRVVAGESYRFECTGNWSIDSETETTADGTGEGPGRLVGVVFSDFTLGDEFELGTSGTFTAPQDGSLYLRCRDEWSRLADNDGTITCRISPAEEKPGASPR